MPRVTFRAKPETIYNPDDTPAWVQIKVPKLDRKHCDMAAFRASPAFGGYANSDLFPAMLARAVRALGVGEYIRLDQLPAGVDVDTSGFLAVVTVHIEERA